MHGAFAFLRDDWNPISSESADARYGKAPHRVLRPHPAGAHAVQAQVTDASTVEWRSESVGFKAYPLLHLCLAECPPLALRCIAEVLTPVAVVVVIAMSPIGYNLRRVACGSEARNPYPPPPTVHILNPMPKTL